MNDDGKKAPHLVVGSEQSPGVGEFLLYTTTDGQSRVECRFENETIWLSQALMAELYETSPQNITLHLKALYKDEEIDEGATCKDYLQVRQEGSREVSRSVKHYNLEAILAVGFRVRSRRGAQFRRWANTRMQEYLVKGFVMDDERLKNPPVRGSTAVPDYFDELLARIRDIRASERRMYLRVRELFSLAADYEPSNTETVMFFRIIQNKLHFAATGQTAAELIHGQGSRGKAQGTRGEGKGKGERAGDRGARRGAGGMAPRGSLSLGRRTAQARLCGTLHFL